MSLKCIDLAEVVDYVSKLDKEEPKTIWKLGVLDTRMRKQLEDLGIEYETDPAQPTTGKAKVKLNLGKSELEFVSFGLKGFENFFDKNGEQIHFKTEGRIVNGKPYHVVAEEILKIIPGNIITELAVKIKEINNIGEAERKN